MQLYTCSLSVAKKYVGFGIVAINTTVKSGKRYFAPTWPMVEGVKSGKITEDEYTKRYLNLLRWRYLIHPERFTYLLEYEIKIALVCYCPRNCFCHRHILAKFLVEVVAPDHGIDIDFKGEIG